MTLQQGLRTECCRSLHSRQSNPVLWLFNVIYNHIDYYFYKYWLGNHAEAAATLTHDTTPTIIVTNVLDIREDMSQVDADSKHDEIITDSKANGNNPDYSELLNSCIYDEIKKRIADSDPYALSILRAAKKHIRDNVDVYKETIKFTLVALKPFYLVFLISILSQTPESV